VRGRVGDVFVKIDADQTPTDRQVDSILTLGHEEHLGDDVDGYGIHVDYDLIRA
jgi:hypothetical protein